LAVVDVRERKMKEEGRKKKGGGRLDDGMEWNGNEVDG
jgi:hypothetical protein